MKKGLKQGLYLAIGLLTFGIIIGLSLGKIIWG